MNEPTEREPLDVNRVVPTPSWRELMAQNEALRDALRAAEDDKEEWTSACESWRASATERLERTAAAESSLTRYKTALSEIAESHRHDQDDDGWCETCAIVVAALEESPDAEEA